MKLSRDDVAPILTIIVSGAIGVLTTAVIAFSLADDGRGDVKVMELRPVAVQRVEPIRTGSITGVVLNAETGRPVQSAQVYIEELRIGVLTRRDGSYLMVNIPAGSHTVTVQRIGYGPVSADVLTEGGETSELDFRMSEVALELNDVVTTVPARARPLPVIFIDGVRVESSTADSPLDDLDPDDIEHIEVIKGPAAVDLYGAEATAGAIQITTKQGASERDR